MAAYMTRCSSCDTKIYQLPHVVTKKSAPIQVHESPDGNIEILRDANGDPAEYRVVPVDERDQYPGQLHKNHYATCPAASSYSRKRHDEGATRKVKP